jgi:DNA-binding LacI/PurR family transcriptional regulator
METSASKKSHLRLDDSNLRPSEKVTRYLLQAFDNPSVKQGSRLPSNRDLAQRLKVSVPTIQAVLRKLSQEGRVQARRGSGTFLVSRPQQATEALRVVVATQLDGPTPLARGVFGGFMPSILRVPRPITLSGLSAQEYGTDAIIDRLMEECGNADALLILPYVLMEPHLKLVTKVYEEAGKAVVSLYPPTINATRNFISADYLGACQLLGRTWKATGRRNIVMLGDDFQNVLSTQLQFMGLTDGLGTELGRSISLQTLVGYFEEETAYTALDELLRKANTPPDAIYTGGSTSGGGILRALRKHGLKVPKDVSVLGLGYASSPGFPGLSQFKQADPQRLGELLAKMLYKCIEKGEPLPGVYLPIAFEGGETTRPEENALLKAGSQDMDA